MPAFRIATYNVLWGGVGRETLICDVMRAINADVAVFTEIMTDQSLDALSPSVGPHRAVSGPAGWKERTAIVSRWPLLSTRQYGPAWNRRKWIEAMVQPSGGPPICVHGIALAAHQLWTHELWRLAEVRRILAHVHGRSDVPQILAGDFNSLAIGDAVLWQQAPIHVRAQWWAQLGLIPRGALAPLARAGFVDCYRACHPGTNGFTIHSTNPTARIDYIFASPQIAPRLRACDVFNAGRASDHLPVFADFDL